MPLALFTNPSCWAQRYAQFLQAYEKGRASEREHIAMNLHDDLGARLCEMLFTAQDEMQRARLAALLKDLKSFTRNLAAPPGEPLARSTARWFWDARQRLHGAGIQVDTFWDVDHNPALAPDLRADMERIVREMVSNVLQHARHAQRVQLGLHLHQQRLQVQCLDDGQAPRPPEQWACGLGLSAIHKRVRRHQGQVQWTPVSGGGVCCRVDIPIAPSRGRPLGVPAGNPSPRLGAGRWPKRLVPCDPKPPAPVAPQPASSWNPASPPHEDDAPA